MSPVRKAMGKPTGKDVISGLVTGCSPSPREWRTRASELLIGPLAGAIPMAVIGGLMLVIGGEIIAGRRRY